MLTGAKSSPLVGLGSKPLTDFLNASAGSVLTYGTPGTKSAMSSFASTYSASRAAWSG